MPKLELAHLLRDPDLEPAPAAPVQVAKGSARLAAIPRPLDPEVEVGATLVQRARRRPGGARFAMILATCSAVAAFAASYLGT